MIGQVHVSVLQLQRISSTSREKVEVRKQEEECSQRGLKTLVQRAILEKESFPTDEIEQMLEKEGHWIIDAQEAAE